MTACWGAAFLPAKVSTSNSLPENMCLLELFKDYLSTHERWTAHTGAALRWPTPLPYGWLQPCCPWIWQQRLLGVALSFPFSICMYVTAALAPWALSKDGYPHVPQRPGEGPGTGRTAQGARAAGHRPHGGTAAAENHGHDLFLTISAEQPPSPRPGFGAFRYDRSARRRKAPKAPAR